MIIWMKEGVSSYEVGRRLRCPHSKVLYWKYRFEKEDITGLQTRSRPGKPPKLSAEKKRRMKQMILEGRSWWKTTWVRDLIYKETGVRFSERHVVRLLHVWGYEQIRPRKQHVEADEEEQKRFVKKTGAYWHISPKAGL